MTNNNNIAFKLFVKIILWEQTIDTGISLVDWAYKSSTCDVMYHRQRRDLHYGGQI
jgi:hypothetical protein